jgi:lipopolysaccharide transport system ATP-binding protein
MQCIELKRVSKVYEVARVPSVVSLRAAVKAPFRAVSTRKVVVDDLSLTISAGERVGIVGRNGAGKTTLLKLMAGLAKPSSGEVSVQGSVTAIMTLGLGIREDVSGRENIYIEGEVQGRSRGEVDRIVDDIVAFADLGEFIDYPVRTYSTGMKARLAFATATHVDPEILVIDEALSVGDAAFSVKATRKIRQLCDWGKIVVIVSHSMGSVVDICNRCLWMDNGRVVMDADPVEVTRAYVDTVRREDDAAVLTRFHALVGSRSHRPGCEITELAVTQEGQQTPRTTVAAGVDTWVRWAARVMDELRDPHARFKIIRLDGTLISESLVPINARGNAFGYAIAMLPLVLAPAVYRLVLEILDGEAPVADRSTTVEVIASKMPRGGRPTLLYPCTVRAERV